MVFKLQLSQIVQNINLTESPSWTDFLKMGLDAAKTINYDLQLIRIPEPNIIHPYKYPVSMFTIQPQE